MGFRFGSIVFASPAVIFFVISRALTDGKCCGMERNPD